MRLGDEDEGMKLAHSLLGIASLLVGCSSTLPPRTVAPREPRAAAETDAHHHGELASRVHASLASHPTTFGRVVVEQRLEGAVRDEPLVFAPSHASKLDTVTARDDRGAVVLRTEESGGKTTLRPATHPEGPLVVHYEVRLDDASAAPVAETSGTASDPCAPSAEPTDLRVGGDDALLLPSIAEPFAFDLSLDTGGGHARAASSFGVGTHVEGVTKSAELARAFFVAGDVATAAFHANDGDDTAGAIGFTSFDPRWVAAESAGVRTGVDQWLGLAPDGAPKTFSIVFTSKRSPRAPVSFARRARGLVVQVDPGAAWTPEARIDLTQRLVQRYVGGALWIGSRDDEASGRFFSEGFSRAIASEVLGDMDMLPHEARASEVNGWLATIALSPLGHAPLADLTRDTSTEAVRVTTARGALAAAWLATSRNERPKASLAGLVRKLLGEAAEGHRDTLPLEAFFARVGDELGADVAHEAEASVRGGKDLALPSDLLGPCYRLADTEIAPFELGLSVRDLVVRSVTPKSRAEAAGVRAGDAVVELVYREGRSDVPVALTVTRDGKPKKLGFLPAGKPARARLFQRVRGIPDDACARPRGR